MNFGARIRQERLARGWTQKELAERAGLKGGQPTLHMIEGRDSIRSKYAPELCAALDISIDWAMTGQGEKQAGRAAAHGKSHPQKRMDALSLRPELLRLCLEGVLSGVLSSDLCESVAEITAHLYEYAERTGKEFTAQEATRYILKRYPRGLVDAHERHMGGVPRNAHGKAA